MADTAFFTTSNETTTINIDRIDSIKHFLSDNNKSSFAKTKLIDKLLDHRISLQNLYACLRLWAIELCVLDESSLPVTVQKNTIIDVNQLVKICCNQLEYRLQHAKPQQQQISAQHLLFACTKLRNFIDNWQSNSAQSCNDNRITS